MKSYSYLCSVVKRRLFFYLGIIGVIAVIMSITLIMSGCGENEEAEASAEGIIIKISEGEEAAYEASEGLPYLERGDRYISGWYLDEGYTKKLEMQEGESAAEIERLIKESGSRLYAKWETKREIEGVRVEDSFFIYDGKNHGLRISGIPEGAEIEYEGEGEYKNAGEYEIRGSIKGYGYKEKEISGKLEIGKRRLDAEGIRLEDASYEWDGEKKYLEVKGEIPADIEVRYKNNGQSEAGEYEVTAEFDTKGNYYEIAPLSARLTIRERKYKIRLIEEDGSEREIEVEHGGEILEIPAPKSKRGYRGYWSEELTEITEDKTLYARYEKERYVIEYVLNGGEIKGEAEKEYEIGDRVELPAAEREHYEFVCWKEGEEEKSCIEEGEIGNRRYEAEWKATEYRIEYDVAGGISSAENIDRYTVESGETELHGAYRYGYEFERWVDEEGEEVSRIGGGIVKGDMVLRAEWRAKIYRIEYKTGGGINAESNAEEYTIEDGVIELGDSAREGYVFLGWYEDAECGGQRVSRIESERCEDIILYAKWESKYEYEESAEGIRITGYKYKYGKEVEIPKALDGKKVTGVARGVLSGAKEIDIKADLTETEGIFEGCNEAEEIRIGEGVRELSEGLFEDCSVIRRIRVPYLGTREIGEEDGRYEPFGMLFGREEKTGTYGVTTTAMIKTEGAEDYDYGNSAQRYIPNSLEEVRTGGIIGGYALEGVKSVKRLEIKGEEVRIGRLALRNCEGLEELRVQGGISEINNTSLLGCACLSEIRVTEKDNIPLFLPVLSKAGIDAQIICLATDFYNKIIL